MSHSGHNRLEALAADIRDAHRASRTAAEQAAERAIAAGHALIEAKDLVQHGEWASWLERSVGFSERTARRYMQLARSGMKTATVADLGIKATAGALAGRRVPKPGTVLQVSLAPQPELGGECWVWEDDDHSGYFHVAGIEPGSLTPEAPGGDIVATRRPVRGPDWPFMTVDRILGNRHAEMRYAHLSMDTNGCERLRRAVFDEPDGFVLIDRLFDIKYQADEARP